MRMSAKCCMPGWYCAFVFTVRLSSFKKSHFKRKKKKQRFLPLSAMSLPKPLVECYSLTIAHWLHHGVDSFSKYAHLRFENLMYVLKHITLQIAKYSLRRNGPPESLTEYTNLLISFVHRRYHRRYTEVYLHTSFSLQMKPVCLHTHLLWHFQAT